MTVSSTTNKQSYNGNNSQSVFAYGFKIFADTDIQVYVGTTLKTLSTHYTLSGVGAAGGGNVTFTTGNIPASGTGNVTILRSLALTQGVDLVNYGRFDAEVIESQYDKLVMMVQQLQEQADRTIRFNTTVSDAGGVEITDTVAERSNKVLAYDNAGDLSVANELGEWKGNWATNTAFAPRDLVLDAATNNVYICLVAHTSGTLSSDVSSSKWALVINASAVAASATTATTKANQASTSASAAATSNTNSGNSATASANSATASANSATASGNSATASGNSATAAASSASTATTKRNESSSSATAAANSATAAASSASSASSAATTAVNAVIDSAPAALNTLNELAAALGDDANFGTTVTNSIATKLPLAGGTMTGDTLHGDGVKSKFGTAPDLEIYHDGSHSYISEVGTGALKLKSDDFRVESASGTNLIKGVGDVASLYNAGNQKLATTSTGVSVTGTATANGLTATSTTTSGNLRVQNSASGATASDGVLLQSNSNAAYLWNYESGDMIFATANAEVMRIASGKVGIGVTPATWHSNYDVLQMGEQTMLYAHADGIGNDSATYLGTNVYENSGAKYLRTDKSSLYRQQSGKHDFYVAPSGAADSAISWNNAMTIDNSGNVLVGKTATTQSTAGTTLYPSGQIYATADNTQPMVLTRKSGDGPITLFYKDATEVGRIGTAASEIFIGSNDAYLWTSGNNNAFLPASTSVGGASNGLLDLGSTGRQFKDVYAYGTVNAGGLVIEGGNLNFSGTSSSAQYIKFGDDSDDDVGSILYYHGNNNMIFKTAATEGMRIDSVGDLLVGSSTSGGGNKIYSNAGVNGAPATSGSTQPAGALRLRGGNNAVLDFGLNGVNTWIQATDLVNLANGYNLSLNPNGGNVGIGTISPGVQLVVEHNSGATSINSIFRSNNTTASHRAGGGFASTGSPTAIHRNARLFLDADGGDFSGSDYFYIDKLGNSGDVRLIQQSNAAMNFYTSGTERMKITSTGHTQWGTFSSTGATSGAQQLYASAARQSSINGTGNSTHLSFFNPNGEVGSIRTSGSSTNFNTSSDYRLKTDVQPMTGATATLKLLKPCNFEWISSGERVDGFLAHELAEVVPAAASGDKDAMRDEEYEVTAAVYEDVITAAVEAVDATFDAEGIELTPTVVAVDKSTESILVTEAVTATRSVPDMQGIDQSKIVPLLTATIQELIARIEALEAV